MIMVKSIQSLIFLGTFTALTTAWKEHYAASNKNTLRSLKGKKYHHGHNNEWYEYEDELIIVLENDDDWDNSAHHGKKGHSKGKHSTSKGKGKGHSKDKQSNSKRKEKGHSKGKSMKKSKKSGIIEEWYYLNDDRWYNQDDDELSGPSAPSKNSKGHPSPSKGSYNLVDDDDDDTNHHPPSKHNKEPSHGKKQTKEPTKYKKQPSKDTKAPKGIDKNPTSKKQTKEPTKYKKQPSKDTKAPKGIDKNPTGKKQTQEPTNHMKQSGKDTKAPKGTDKNPTGMVSKSPTKSKNSNPSKYTSAPTMTKKLPKNVSPTKNSTGANVPTVGKKDTKATKAPVTNTPKNSTTKAPKDSASGGKQAKCPKGNTVDETKVIIDYEYEVVIDDKKIQDNKGAKDVISSIENELVKHLSKDLVTCSNNRALSSSNEEKNSRRLAELLAVEATKKTTTINENTCITSWTGDYCSMTAVGEVEATVDGRSVDSSICAILQSISDFLENDITVKGVKDVKFISTTNDCKQGIFAKSNTLQETWGKQEKVAWWIVMIIIISIILLLYTFCMVFRRRKYNNNGVKKYEDVNDGNVTRSVRNHFPRPLVGGAKSSNADKSLYPTIDVKPCTSALCNSCSSEESEDMQWIKTGDV